MSQCLYVKINYQFNGAKLKFNSKYAAKKSRAECKPINIGQHIISIYPIWPNMRRQNSIELIITLTTAAVIALLSGAVNFKFIVSRSNKRCGRTNIKKIK
jgi:hypothetical protein